MLLIEKILSITVVILVISLVVVPIADDFTEDNGIDVILIDGQSNGAYWTNKLAWVNPSVVNKNLGAPEHKALYYGSENASTNEVTSDSKIRSMYRDNSWKIGGNEAGLAYYLMQKNNRDVLVLNISVTGTGIQTLATGSAWTNGEAVINNAMSAIRNSYSNVNIIGWVLIHGEADKNNTVEHYEQYFNILAGKLSNLGFEQCYIGLPRVSQAGNAYDAMIDLAQNEPNVHIATNITSTFTNENGLLYTDNTHYTQLGRLVLDKAIVDYIPATPSEGMDGASLIHVIPIVLFIGVIMMAVRLIYIRTS